MEPAQFSQEEIQKIIGLGKVLAGKAVLHALIHVIETYPAADRQPMEALVAAVRNKIPCEYSGYLSITIADMPLTLHVSLSIVDKDYRTEISIPSEDYAADLVAKYNFLMGAAVAYWRQFIEENPDLYRRCTEYCEGVDLSVLTVARDKSCTLYFSPDTERRIGIFCYYVDKQGRPFYKNTI